jgi:hypothetical protein
MNWFEYYFGHCFQTGWREMWNNFKMWRDLISGNYADYAILSNDDPYEECYNWFWTSINLDECYSKEFLEYLQQLMRDIDSGKEKVYPMDDVMERTEDNGWKTQTMRTLEELSTLPLTLPHSAL